MTVREFYTSVGGDYDAAKKIMMMDKMILRFLPKIAEDPSYARLEEARKNKDRQGMFAALHALKGVCANLGLTTLSNLASDALEPIRPGTGRTISDEELEARIAKVREQYEMTMKKINELSWNSSS